MRRLVPGSRAAQGFERFERSAKLGMIWRWANERRLQDAYRFAGLRPLATVRGVFGDPKARIVRAGAAAKKTACGACGRWHRSFYDRRRRLVRDLSCGDTRIYLEVEVRRVACRSCGTVKRERLEWLADNPFYTKRFAFFVGRRCRVSHDQGRGRGTAPGLGVGQDAGEAVHARAVAPRRALRHRAPSGSTRSRSARGTRTGSWSATWSGCGRSGSAARTARKPAWTSSSPGSGRRRAGAFSWR